MASVTLEFEDPTIYAVKVVLLPSSVCLLMFTTYTLSVSSFNNLAFNTDKTIKIYLFPVLKQTSIFY